MTETQYQQAEADLISIIQSMRERECGHLALLEDSDGDVSENSLDDPVQKSYSSEYEWAKDELSTAMW